MLRARLELDTPNAALMLASLLPEMGRELPRTRASARTEGGSLVVDIEAHDSSSMRAALNSYLGWIRITEEVIELIGE